MLFEEALKHLRAGESISRDCWNDKWMVIGNPYPAGSPKAAFLPPHSMYYCFPWVTASLDDVVSMGFEAVNGIAWVPVWKLETFEILADDWIIHTLSK
jgi:hypothetical protein